MNRNSEFIIHNSILSARSRVRAVLALVVIAMLLLAGCKSKLPKPSVV